MEEYPTYQFSSTSSSTTIYTGGGIGGMSTAPTLGADGRANAPFSGPMRAGATGAHSHYDRDRNGYCDVCGQSLGGNAGTPEGQVDPSKQIPMGDGIVLMLMLAMVAAVKIYRRWRLSERL